MNRDETEKAIAVMQAWVDGKTVIVRRRAIGTWSKKLADCTWNWHEYEYDIRPEPREWLINIETRNVGTEVTGEPFLPLTPGVVRVREVIED